MADLSGIKKKRLGTPPGADEASSNLEAPETAPIATEPAPKTSKRAPRAAEPTAAPAVAKAHAQAVPVGMDFRFMRRSPRTVTLATRVTPDFDNTVRQFAQTKGLTIVEVLEAALEAYKREQSSI